MLLYSVVFQIFLLNIGTTVVLLGVGLLIVVAALSLLRYLYIESPVFRSVRLFCWLVSQIKVKIVWTNCDSLPQLDSLHVILLH